MEKTPAHVENDSYGGKYKDEIHNLPEEVKLPSGAIPKGANPTPFKLGPQTSGSR